MAVVLYCLFVFFFKQKTAYEMRISDWSSDVCSSDLLVGADVERAPSVRRRPGELVAVVEREPEIARRVAFAAMRHRFGEIGAPVPLRAAIGIGPERRRRVEHPRPQ